MMWWIALAMNLPNTACTPVFDNRLVAADLARAVPEFASAPPDVEIGFAPAPGARRVIHIGELRRFAARFGVQLTSNREACFEWKIVPVSSDAAIIAMKDALKLPDARIELLEMKKRDAPGGTVEFPLSGLIPAAERNSGLAFWRGYVRYGEGRRFDLLARVRISAPTDRVIAATAIAVGHPIEPGQVRLETVTDFPLWNGAAKRLDEVVGRIARRSIDAGQAVLRTELAEPLAVKAGDDVEVEVTSGHTHLKLEARAENSGRQGDMISVRNPKSGKLFRARVESKGKVIVMPGVSGGMVN